MPFVDEIGRTIASDRQEGMRLGLRLYNGAACAHGHADGIRYTSTRHCYDCQEARSIVRTRKARKYDRERKARQRALARAHLNSSPLARLVQSLLHLD